MRVGFYAGLNRNGRRALLAGPFDTYQEAAASVEAAHLAACKINPFHWFDTPGVYRIRALTLPLISSNILNEAGRAGDRLSSGVRG